MGIGRLDFLKLTGLALAGLVIDPLKVVAINDNSYVNKKLGILFNKPAGWGYIAVKDFGKLKNEQIIGEGLNESIDEIWEELGEPICITTKYFQDTPESKGIFSPTITLNVTPKEELDYLGFDSFESIIEMSEEGTSRILKDFKVIKRHVPFLINDCKCYEFDAEYMFEHVDLNSALKVELKVLKIEHNGCYYDFNCHQSKTQNQTAQIEFEEFKNSIRLL